MLVMADAPGGRWRDPMAAGRLARPRPSFDVTIVPPERSPALSFGSPVGPDRKSAGSTCPTGPGSMGKTREVTRLARPTPGGERATDSRRGPSPVPVLNDE